jgi:predicted porin
MQRLLLALAVTGALNSVAHAQTNVQLYGTVEGGVSMVRGGPAGPATVAAGPSSFGFTGKENLGGGLVASFNLEAAFSSDTGSLYGATANPPMFFDKQAYLLLAGPWGSVAAGRIYTRSFSVLALVADPFICALVPNAAVIMETSGVRMNNAVRYGTPVFKGFSAEVAVGLGETPGDFSANRAISSVVGYVQGPLVVKLTNHRANSSSATSNVDINNTLLAASYTFKVARISGAYAVNRRTGALTGTRVGDSTDLLLGITVPAGNGAILASYIRKNDQLPANDDATQVGLGYIYNLSNLTNLYAVYAKVRNKNTLKYKISSAYGVGDTAYTFGIRKSF